MMDATSTPNDHAADRGASDDAGYSMIIADFADAESALQSYQALKDIEAGHTLGVEGAIVVSRATDGTLTVLQVTDHTTRRGFTWGAIGGAVVGLVFPPSLIGAAVVSGAAGAAIAKGARVHHDHALASEVEYAITPGHHGLVALVSDPDAREIAQALDKADRVVRKSMSGAAAADVHAAAREAVGGAEAG